MTDRQQCQSCSAPSMLWICPRCTQELKAQLHSLAHGPSVNGKPTTGLLDALEDVALKRTCMGTGSGHRKKGDEMPIPFLPDGSKKVKDKNGEVSEVTIASPQGWASTLLVAARNTLSTIVRDICESRGLDVMRAFRFVPGDLVGPLMPGWRRAYRGWGPTMGEQAMWLANAVHAIACDESAGLWRRDVDSLVRRIEKAVDRPTKIETLGFCITQLEEGVCGTTLRAPQDAIEVHCRKCKATRRCDTVRAQGQSDARRALIPWSKVLETNKMQPEDWRVNERTLRDWRNSGLIKPHGSEVDVPLFKWNDVEQLRTHGVKRGERKRTRAGR